MKILYYTSTGVSTQLLVDYQGEPYLVRYWHEEDEPPRQPLTLLYRAEGDTIEMAFERFLKFALVPWYEFDDGCPSYDQVIARTDKIFAAVK